MSIAEQARVVRAHPSWSLPHRAYPTQPSDPAAQIPWAFEQLIEFYVQTDEDELVEVLHAFRPDLTYSQLAERIERLCALSVDVDELRHGSSGRWPSYEALVDEYAAALTALATLPVTS